VVELRRSHGTRTSCTPLNFLENSSGTYTLLVCPLQVHLQQGDGALWKKFHDYTRYIAERYKCEAALPPDYGVSVHNTHWQLGAFTNLPAGLRKSAFLT